MFASLFQFIRVKTRSKVVAAAIAAAGILALTGGWALAGRTGLIAGSRVSLTSARMGSPASSGAAVPSNHPQAAGQQATGQPAAGPHGAGQLPAGLLPTSLLLAGPQRLSGNDPLGPREPGDHSATGGGQTTPFNFGFTAQSHKNGQVAGTVTGNAQFSFQPPFRGELHVQVNCLEIVGNDAFMSGVLLREAFGLTTGTEILFGVRDDDSAAKPDLISDVFFSPAPPFTCHTFHAHPHYAVQGNVEIH